MENFDNYIQLTIIILASFTFGYIKFRRESQSMTMTTLGTYQISKKTWYIVEFLQFAIAPPLLTTLILYFSSKLNAVTIAIIGGILLWLFDCILLGMKRRKLHYTSLLAELRHSFRRSLIFSNLIKILIFIFISADFGLRRILHLITSKLI